MSAEAGRLPSAKKRLAGPDGFALAALGLSLMLHGAAAWRFQFIELTPGLPREWSVQFYALLAASFTLNLALMAVRNALAQVCLAGLRILALVLIGLPLGRDVGIEVMLQAAVLFDFAVHARPAVGLVFSLLLLAACLAAQRPVLAWNVEVPAPGAAGTLTLGATGVAGLAAAQLILRGRRRCLSAERRVAQLEETVAQLTDANLGFQSYAAAIGRNSVLEERNRLSRDVHDTIGYTLTNLTIMLEACQDLIDGDPDPLRQMLLRAGEVAQDGLQDTRRALHALRQTGVEELRGVRAIQKLVDAFEGATGTKVAVEYGNIPWSMGDAVDGAIYRLLQEGLTNSFKHGRASRITVTFWKTERDVLVNIRDNGQGSKEIIEGIGISGMRERVEALGGEIRARNAADGFELSATIPFGGTTREEP
jgi:signal transduction histidine kinase